jgi:hypothetical protein
MTSVEKAVPRLLLGTSSGGVGIEMVSVVIDRHGCGLVPVRILTTLLSAVLPCRYRLWAKS